MTEVTVIRAFLERDGDLERNKWGNYQSDSKQSITNRKMETVYVENAYLENTSVFFFFFLPGIHFATNMLNIAY